uniref:Uncharacterized protein n=1 Tax=Lactuca sativa TaxID=4236 RepID=A0A9R1VEC7_LACSA|nr:hypothetical protein LSAT_V11C500289920 [Lactuca sativa]
MKNTEAIHENANVETISSKSTTFESDSMEIIGFSPHFSPYKSIKERVILEEVSTIVKEDEQFERKRKRVFIDCVELNPEPDEVISSKNEPEEHMPWNSWQSIDQP